MRGQRLYIIQDERIVYSGRIRAKVLRMKARFWPDAEIKDTLEERHLIGVLKDPEHMEFGEA